MKHFKKLSKLSLGAAFLLASSSVFAYCPPIVPCTTTAQASTISGSNADEELITFTQTITTTTNETAQALVDMATANASSLSTGAQTVVSAQAELSQIEINQKLKVEKAMADREMAHKSQMVENAFRANTAIVSSDDTKEEFQLILDTLSSQSSKTVPEIILLLKETFDKDDELGYVPVPIKASEGVCDTSDTSETGNCSIAKRIYPGQKLSALFKQCSANKRKLIEKERQNKSRVASAEVAEQESKTAMETTDVSGSVTRRMASQQVLSCSPAQYKAGLCGDDLSAEDYQESIVIGNIIPNGDVSATNFNAPTAASSHGYIDDLDDDVQDEVRAQSLDRDDLIDNPNQRAVDLVNTYRNANQVKASMDFINNLVGADLVPALDASDRRKASNAEYQSRMMSRASALSMVRLALNESMFERVGEKMRTMIEEGEFDGVDRFEINTESSDNKESVLGAGPLDILQDRVKQQAATTQVSAQNGDSPNSGNDFVADPSGADALEKVLASVSLQNEMLMKEYLITEQTLSLKAISNAQYANSPAVVSLMKELRQGNK
ncbi:hypothetical protein [Alteromonas sp. 14N.309.X.WAT.G.H12]|uniref:hypothetical protein n=1 Tax=Alteromonas sp. 14N.309.X.WAT.G.H12 TaxID=3120824 RepID=UPI002FCF2448